ncbi:hypothetical protein SAMN02745866_04362 [Alteromonadaceae bacterium Bs31]|nr:hypothetical protein SAMN02745866_04362 [Alteromonadaceae bacterium Bs31]
MSTTHNQVVNADIAYYTPFWVAGPLYTKKSLRTQCRLPQRYVKNGDSNELLD